MAECIDCGAKNIGYAKYRCYNCKKKLAGSKPRKHRNLCHGCTNDYYNNKYADKNPFGGKGCMSYKNSDVIMKNVYYSSSQVVPSVAWKLECFNYKRN